MNKHLTAAAMALSLGFTGNSLAHAQNAERTYENGPVISISYVETKPGMFNDYMQFLSTGWRAEQEADKKRGDVLEYHVVALADARDNEPDLMLVVIYKNMAVFDRSQAEQDKQAATLQGSVAKVNAGVISRESMRKMRGEVLGRELTFTK